MADIDEIRGMLSEAQKRRARRNALIDLLATIAPAAIIAATLLAHWALN